MKRKHSLFLISALPFCSMFADSDIQSAKAYTAETTDLVRHTKNSTESVVEIVSEAGAFNILLEAVKAAGMQDVLEGEGPITIFAPTDDAFRKKLENVARNPHDPSFKRFLQEMLSYHIVPGTVTAEEMRQTPGLTSLRGTRINIRSKDDSVMANTANVIQNDIMASNGVIHIIDDVLLSCSKSVGCVPLGDPERRFRTFLTAQRGVTPMKELFGDNSITLFVPTDEAFAKLPEGMLERLLKPENQDQLDALVRNHYLTSRVYSDDVDEDSSLKTLNGDHIHIQQRGSELYVNGAKIIETNIDKSNGVVHMIDTVLIPSMGTGVMK